jgi:lipopolysaccharide biosynthesis glycosyltransferase
MQTGSFFVGNAFKDAYNRAASMINLCYCGNAKILPGLLLSLLSLRETSAEPLTVYLLTADLSFLNKDYEPIPQKNRAYLEKVLQEKNKDSQVILLDETRRFYPLFQDSPNLKTPYTPYSMLRLIFDLEMALPSHLLYLDTDAIALKDISSLYHFGPWANATGRWLSMRSTANSSTPITAIPGVILFDLEKDKTRRTSRRRPRPPQRKEDTRCQTKRPSIGFGRDKILFLPRIYNEQREIFPDTVIRHYCQQVRPLPVMHVEKAKPWDGEKYHKAYPKVNLLRKMNKFYYFTIAVAPPE